MNNEYWIVKLKVGPRWLDAVGRWTPNRLRANRYCRDQAYVDAGRMMVGGAITNAADVSVVHVTCKRKKKQTIPMPTVTITNERIVINGWLINDYTNTEYMFLQIRHALGMPACRRSRHDQGR